MSPSLRSTRSVLTIVTSAPVEEMSDDESTGGPIPFGDSDAKKDGPGNDKNDEGNDEGNDDEEGEEV